MYLQCLQLIHCADPFKRDLQARLVGGRQLNVELRSARTPAARDRHFQITQRLATFVQPSTVHFWLRHLLWAMGVASLVNPSTRYKYALDTTQSVFSQRRNMREMKGDLIIEECQQQRVSCSHIQIRVLETRNHWGMKCVHEGEGRNLTSGTPPFPITVRNFPSRLLRTSMCTFWPMKNMLPKRATLAITPEVRAGWDGSDPMDLERCKVGKQ